MMKASGSEKGKRPLTEKMERPAGSMEPANTEEETTAATDAGMRASSSSCSLMKEEEEGGGGGAKAPHLLEGTYSSLTFTELLAAHEGNSCSGLDRIEEESDGERSGASVSISMKGSKRGSSQLPNLDLSLLPSRESSELVRTPQKNRTQPAQWPPFSGLRAPYFGGLSPVNKNAFSQQQQCTQLTIFYGGTVNVYNVSPDMARAIMVLASSGVSTKAASTAATPTSFAPVTPATVSSIAPEIVCPSLPTGRGAQIQPAFTLKAANLPISRKNSLQRFLEKRNDRLHARAPYAPLRQN